MNKSKERVKKNSEVFTPQWLVLEMLSKLPDDAWQENKTWLEPAAGDGNFVVEIIRIRLEKGHNPYKILETVFAVELMQDNVDKMKERILELINLKDCSKAKEIVDKNIRQGNFLEIQDLGEFFNV